LLFCDLSTAARGKTFSAEYALLGGIAMKRAGFQSRNLSLLLRNNGESSRLCEVVKADPAAT
jgi:hypothetical protein